MADNGVNFTKPKERMPARWRKHADILAQTRADIDALSRRLHQETRDFLDVMKEDMNPIDRFGDRTNITPEEQKVMAGASWWHDKNVRDALVLECASERVEHATPGDWRFEYADAATHPPSGAP
jgi:hypothetical protein